MAITTTNALVYRYSDMEYWTGSAWSTVNAYTRVTYQGAAHYWRIKPDAVAYKAIIKDDDPYLNDSTAAGDPNPEVTAYAQTIEIQNELGTTVLSQRVFSADSAAIHVKMSTDTKSTTSPADDTYVDTNTNVYSIYTMATWGGTGAIQNYFLFAGTAPVPGVVYETGPFSGTSSDTGTYGNDTTVVNQLIADLVCFVSGTMIMTDRGERPIETLSVGDLILTADHGYQPIRWIGSRTVDRPSLAGSDRFRPIRIRAGALGGGMPQRDLYVSRQHRILLRSKIARRMFDTDEILVPAIRLVGLPGIDIVTDCDEVSYHHFLFDRHEIVLSNGSATESLFTGPEAMRSVSPEARGEILSLFPELLDHDYECQPARLIPTGKQARQLVTRHAKNGRQLTEAAAR